MLAWERRCRHASGSAAEAVAQTPRVSSLKRGSSRATKLVQSVVKNTAAQREELRTDSGGRQSLVKKGKFVEISGEFMEINSHLGRRFESYRVRSMHTKHTWPSG